MTQLVRLAPSPIGLRGYVVLRRCWSGQRGSNSRSPARQAGVLPLNYARSLLASWRPRPDSNRPLLLTGQARRHLRFGAVGGPGRTRTSSPRGKSPVPFQFGYRPTYIVVVPCSRCSRTGHRRGFQGAGEGPLTGDSGARRACAALRSARGAEPLWKSPVGQLIGDLPNRGLGHRGVEPRLGVYKTPVLTHTPVPSLARCMAEVRGVEPHSDEPTGFQPVPIPDRVDLRCEVVMEEGRGLEPRRRSLASAG